MSDDRIFLKRAIEIAGEGVVKGNGPFGAVIVRDNKIIAEAENSVILSHDPTAHAEINAIRKTAAILETHDLSDCVLYSSCEPCPMCLGAIYWSGIRKIVYASRRSDAENAGFRDSMIYDEMNMEPSDRQLDFIRIAGLGEVEVFEQWKEYESKISY
ncbi:MAG: nucleoside deaminase [Bacteroidetes bacterium]|nr:nucleoside deaminase [Bacteroidota bacterium]